MKKIITADIGGQSFILDEDAFALLHDYLIHFKATVTDPHDVAEVMTDIEARAAGMLQESLQNGAQSVDRAMADAVVSRLGKPKGWKDGGLVIPPRRRLCRDTEHRLAGGVCSGIAAACGVRVTVVRVVFGVAALLLLAGLWAYLILWVTVPKKT
ncbi:MAG: PspC domain-containing protein [Prevotellaceae bacterium]|nr:PspC domain-containing protein [Prevotellaceae bacterium]